jgi:hypothetical protein
VRPSGAIARPSRSGSSASPTAGLLIIPRSGHTISLEEPDLFNRHVLDFVTVVDAGRWTPRNPASLSRSAILPTDWQS